MPDQVRRDGCWKLMSFLLVAACSPDTPPVVIDGSTPERFAATITAAREQLNPTDRLAFDQALGSIASRRHAASNPNAIARTTFDGMTGVEIADDFRQRSTNE